MRICKRCGRELWRWETRCIGCGYPVTSSPPQEITWEYVGAFVDGEGYIDARIEDRKRLHAYFEILQTDTERDAIKLLEDIRGFIKKELDIEGTIRLRVPPADFGLFYERMMDVYKLCHAILPHLRLGHRIKQAKSTIETIETWVEEKHKETGELVERGYDRIIKGHHARYKDMLKTIQEIRGESLRNFSARFSRHFGHERSRSYP